MSEFRVIPHEPVCPDCRSSNITEQEIDITDGSTETALLCTTCGAAWPLACIAENLETIFPAPPVRPHLVLRIDARPPGTAADRRLYWCPACDTYLSGTDLANAPVLHYEPGPARIITTADLTTRGARP